MAKNTGDKKGFSATYGELFVNGESVQELLSAEVKISINYNEIKPAGSTSMYRKYAGQEVSGTFKISMVSSKFSSILTDMVKNGYAPEINMQIISKDPAHAGSVAFGLDGVTFDEILLAKVESGALIEQEIPFKAVSITPKNKLD